MMPGSGFVSRKKGMSRYQKHGETRYQGADPKESRVSTMLLPLFSMRIRVT